AKCLFTAERPIRRRPAGVVARRSGARRAARARVPPGPARRIAWSGNLFAPRRAQSGAFTNDSLMLRHRPALSACLRVALIAAASVALAAKTLAAPVKTAHVEAELVAAQTALVPGEPLTVALRLSMQKGWHTYWQNPGDSGLPTTLEWKLPSEISAGPIEWPAPHALPAGPLVNYGYDGEVLHLVQLTPPQTRGTGATAGAAARAHWAPCHKG